MSVLNICRHRTCGLWGRLLSAAALLALLAGCGFHLQGRYSPPSGVNAVHVVYHNAYRPGEPALVDRLQQRLRMLGVLGGSNADARLIIRSVRNINTGVAVSPIDADTVEYKLQTSVVFDYVVNKRPVLTAERLAVTRFYTYNEDVRLAAEAERKDLMDSMERELADRILFRITNVTTQEDSANE